MASIGEPLNIPAYIRTDLRFALKATRQSLGVHYGIKKLQKERFYDNVSDKEIESEQIKSFHMLKSVEQVNETDTEFHVEKKPTLRKGSTGKEVKVEGGAEAGACVQNVAKVSTFFTGAVRKESSDAWVECDQAIPAKTKLRRETGYSVSVCKVELSLRAPSYTVDFYETHWWGRKTEAVPARAILSKLKGWDESRGTAIIEIEHQVEAERHVITNIET